VASRSLRPPRGARRQAIGEQAGIQEFPLLGCPPKVRMMPISSNFDRMR